MAGAGIRKFYQEYICTLAPHGLKVCLFMFLLRTTWLIERGGCRIHIQDVLADGEEHTGQEINEYS